MLQRIILLKKLRNFSFETVINVCPFRRILTDEIALLINAKHRLATKKFDILRPKFLNNYFDNQYSKMVASDILNEYDKQLFVLNKITKNHNVEPSHFYIKSKTEGEMFKRLLLKSFDLKNDLIISISPFASDIFRSWPLNNFYILIREIVNKIECKIVLLGTENYKNDLDHDSED